MSFTDPAERLGEAFRADICILRRFLIETSAPDQGLALTVDLWNPDHTAGLTVTFSGVRELSVDWPKWTPVRLDLLNVQNVAEDQLETLSYRVWENAGTFSFWCHDIDIQRHSHEPSDL